jgi:hypothetical protein
MSDSNCKFYLIHNYGCTDPSIIAGPFDDYDTLLGYVKDFYDSDDFDQETDGLICLSVDAQGVPSVDSFKNYELEDE